MKIISWNINSLRARLELVEDLITTENPDVLLFQETKVEDSHFPKAFFDTLGYEVAFWGQKSYNGVAIASRFPISDVGRRDFGQGARYLEGKIHGIRVVCLYVVNGQSLTSDAYAQKLDFLNKVRQHVTPYLFEPSCTLVAGDFNVAPYDKDVYEPAAWRDSILFSLKERESLRAWFYQGWQDCTQISSSQDNEFTWWPYQGRGWEKDHGLRIDFILSSPWGSHFIRQAGVLKEWRGKHKPSDHAPVWVSMNMGERL